MLAFQGFINCTWVIYFIETKLLKSYHKRDFGGKKLICCLYFYNVLICFIANKLYIFSDNL